MDARPPFARWLRQRRHLLDLTQAELAECCHCSAVTIRKLEAGARRPSRELALALGHVLRVPEREHGAFVHFARSNEVSASFHLPAWEPQQASWRSGQLPERATETRVEGAGTTLHYDLVAQEAPEYSRVADGRFLVNVEASGTVTGDLEGTMSLHILQIIQPKPPGMGYTEALPMQIGAHFRVQSGDDFLEGTYTGSLAPMLDAPGNGYAREQGAGQVLFVSTGLIDLFLAYVFVQNRVRMVEGRGTGGRGVMRLKSPS